MIAHPAAPTTQETSKVWTGPEGPAVVFPVSFPVAFAGAAPVVLLDDELGPVEVVDAELVCDELEAVVVSDVLVEFVVLFVDEVDSESATREDPAVAPGSAQPARSATKSKPATMKRATIEGGQASRVKTLQVPGPPRTETASH